VAEFEKDHHLKEALIHKVSKKEDVRIENLELSPKLKVSRIYKHQGKNLSDYDKLDDDGKLVFLAGVFDGEGSFGIWSKLKKRKYLACSVETSDRDMVERFYKFFGGCMYLCKKRQAHHKDTWRWRINGLGALQSLDKMISYMCKRRQEKYRNVVECLKIRT
jgi:hypothetical protein